MDYRRIFIYVLLLIFRSRAARFHALCLRKIQGARERRIMAFRRFQAQQRFYFVIFLSAVICAHLTVDRSVWSHERSSTWWDRIVSQSFNEGDWLENFRMSRGTFLYLCAELKSLEKRDTVMRRAIPLEQRVAIALWRLATNGDYRTIAHLFGVSRASVCLIVRDVCDAIVQVLLPKYIQAPHGERLQSIVDGFASKWGFPQCVGAIDGSHIPIVSPLDCPADYYNRKGFHSIILQAVVDHEYRFWNINVGWPGRVHDARVFTNSELFEKAQAGTLLPSSPRFIHGVNVPLVILADPAYPLLPWLMKPYVQHGNLSVAAKNFNYRLSRARMVVENAFGRLKGRWRCLLKRNDTATEDVPTIISACCVLHNICEVHKEQFDETWMEELASGVNASSPTQNTSTNTNAESIRTALCNYMNS